MNKKLPKVLVADDEEYTRVYFKRILSPELYNVSLVKDGAEALQKWSNESFDLIIMDIRMPGVDGMEVLKQIRMRDTETMIIIISAYGDMDSVIEAMRLGANDFFAKPFSSIDKIKLDIKNCLERRNLQRENELLRERISSGGGLDCMVYSSKAMEVVIEQATRIARLEIPVLIEGESGTGKELVARYIHAKGSRVKEPFFAVNCGALSETLLETALFGYEKGAFTGANSRKPGYFEAAGGGTIFLDEISETSPSFQVKLLRVLQEGDFMRVGGTKTIKMACRLLSATNMDVATLVNQGVFRKDLLYRINVIKIVVPPLRERTPDIPLLLDHFMHQICERNKIRKKKFSSDVLTSLMQHPWEGNVRELRNLVERLAVFSRHQVIMIEDLPREYKYIDADSNDQQSFTLNFERAKSFFELEYYKNLFAAANGDIKKASAMSGLNLSTLYRRRNKLGK